MSQCCQVACLTLVLASLPAWAETVKAPGIPNFHQVNEHIFRGGQPTQEGWKNLARLGVRTVIDLRREHSSEAEARAVEAAGMRYISVPLNGFAAPTDEQVSRVLAVLNSEEPVFVHCKGGKDRAGTMIACYRIAHDRWQNRKALAEAESYGFHWFENGMKRYILSFQAPVERATAGVDLQPVAARP